MFLRTVADILIIFYYLYQDMNLKDLKQQVSDLLKHKKLPHIKPFKSTSTKLQFQKQTKQICQRFGQGKCLIKLKNNCYYYGLISDGYSNDKESVFVFTDGAYYMGQIVKGVFEGEGKLVKGTEDNVLFSYEGSYLDNRPHGFGIETITNSMQYKGQFKEGKKHGKGIMTFADHSIFDGMFEHNSITGYGVFKTKAHQWTGTWNSGYLQGQGKQISYGLQGDKEKSEYVGKFDRGHKKGQGVYKWGNSETAEYRGQFLDGQLNGNGVFKLGTKQFEGVWKKGYEVEMVLKPPKFLTNSIIHLKKSNKKTSL